MACSTSAPATTSEAIRRAGEAEYELKAESKETGTNFNDGIISVLTGSEAVGS